MFGTKYHSNIKTSAAVSAKDERCCITSKKSTFGFFENLPTIGFVFIKGGRVVETKALLERKKAEVMRILKGEAPAPVRKNVVHSEIVGEIQRKRREQTDSNSTDVNGSESGSQPN